MKRLTILIIFLSVIFPLPGCGHSSETQYRDAVERIIKEESVAGVKLNGTADDVEAFLGEE